MDTPTRAATEDTVSEHIPWQQLTVPPRPRSGRILLAVALAVGLAAVGLLIGRASAVSPPPPDPAASASSAVPSPPASVSPVPAPTPTDPLREADLRAAPAAPPAALAMARAEWFLLEYLTRLGDPTQKSRLAAAGGWPADPAGSGEEFDDVDDEVGASYVEWVRAISVEVLDSNTFLVGAVVSRLAAPARGEQFTRVALEGWQVTVGVDPGGATAVTAWPVPIAMPASGLTRVPEPGGEHVDRVGLVFPIGPAQAP